MLATNHPCAISLEIIVENGALCYGMPKRTFAITDRFDPSITPLREIHEQKKHKT
jgi:hypothetical protein